MIVATMTTPIEDMQDHNLCENNTEGDDGQRSETETVPLESAPVVTRPTKMIQKAQHTDGHSLMHFSLMTSIH
jgi:hypothetical protein